MLTGMRADAATVGKLLRRVGGGGAGARDGGRPKGRPTLVVRQTSFSGYFPEGSLSRRERVGVRGSCNLPLIFPSSCPSPGGRRDSSFCFAYWNMRKSLFDGVLEAARKNISNSINDWNTHENHDHRRRRLHRLGPGPAGAWGGGAGGTRRPPERTP